jgi:NAD(P)H-hydrate epimerase
MTHFEKITTHQEIIEIEKNTINNGTSVATLILRASEKISDHIERTINKDSKILFILGKGKNGQDGYGVFNNLINKNYNCSILFVFTKSDYSEWEINTEISGKKSYYLEDSEDYKNVINTCDIIVDGIFGTGLNRPIDGKIQKLIYYLNKLNKHVISIDIPSGLSESNLKISEKNTIIASKTLSLTAIKQSCLNINTNKYANQIINLNIGITEFPDTYLGKYLINREYATKFIHEKNKYGSKRDSGNTTIIGGSIKFPGAILMSANACMETGIGLISLCIPNNIYTIIAGQIPEVSLDILENPDKNITIRNISEIIKKKRLDSILIGPGMETNKSTINAMEYFIHNIHINNLNGLVIDADGINCLSNIDNWWKSKLPKNTVITPHIREMSRLTKLNIADIESNPFEIISHYSKKWKTTIVLKGPLSYISDGNNTYVLNHPNPAMSKGGTGDVLAGLINGFLAQQSNSLCSSILGVSLLSLAGEWSKLKHGILGSSATKLIQGIKEINKNA